MALDGVEPSAVFWRVLGVTESEAHGTSRGLRVLLSSRRHQAGLAAILQPVALAPNVDSRRVMQ